MSRRRLFTFIGRRLAALVLVLLAMSFLIFALLDLAPGNAVQLLLGPREATPATVAAIRHEYHLDQPFIVQYLDWLRGAVHFDFGTSIVSGRAGQAGEIIGQLGYSLELRRARLRLRVRGRDPTWSPSPRCDGVPRSTGRWSAFSVAGISAAGIRNRHSPAVHLRDQARLVPRFRRGKRLLSPHLASGAASDCAWPDRDGSTAPTDAGRRLRGDRAGLRRVRARAWDLARSDPLVLRAAQRACPDHHRQRPHHLLPHHRRGARRGHVRAAGHRLAARRLDQLQGHPGRAGVSRC